MLRKWKVVIKNMTHRKEIIVVDGGSTKADWLSSRMESDSAPITTRGVNPFLHTKENITDWIRQDLNSKWTDSKGIVIYYYGAGCSDQKRCALMKNALSAVFPHASIQVEHDLLAAARALCGDAPGIACILGTGSNSCLYNGQEIVDNIPSLGYLLGDEGSGGQLGKFLLRAFYYREMPDQLAADFKETYAKDKVAVWDNIYGGHPNVYLASLAPFTVKHKGHPYIDDLVRRSFRQFITSHVVKYTGHGQLPISVVGSIGIQHRDIMKSVLSEFELIPGNFIHKPIFALLQYHMGQENHEG